MAIRLSSLYGKKIFSSRANFVGEVDDIYIDTDDGEAVGLTLSDEEGVAIPYPRINAMGDIVLVQAKS